MTRRDLMLQQIQRMEEENRILRQKAAQALDLLDYVNEDLFGEQRRRYEYPATGLGCGREVNRL